MARNRAMTIRFTEAQQKILREEARMQGMSFTEFVRHAAVAAALYERGKRGGDEKFDQIAELIEQLRES